MAKARRVAPTPSCRLTFELGEAFQFDWSEEALVVGGIYRRLQVSHLKLCASRAFWLVAYPSQGHEMLFDAHTRIVHGAGRHSPARHLRQHEDRGGQGQEGQGPDRQRALRGDVRALPVRCRLLQRRLGLGEGRGREERAGQSAAHLAGRGRQRFGSFVELNAWLGERCRALWRRSRTPSTRSSAWPRCSNTSAAPDADARAVRRLRREAGARVQHLPGERGSATATRCRASWSDRWSARGCIRTRVAVVADDARGCQPRAADPTAGRPATTGSTTSRWCSGSPVRCGTARRSPTCPSRCSSCGARCCADAGGDRVMAQVLAVVPTAGLEAVLVAVELVLETGPPGGERRACAQRAGAAERRPVPASRPRRHCSSPRRRWPTPAATTACARRTDGEEIDHA